MLDPRVLDRISTFMSDAGSDLLFLAIGTSGTVSPAAGLVDEVNANAGVTWLIDAEPSTSFAGRFDRVIAAKSGEALPPLVSALRRSEAFQGARRL